MRSFWKATDHTQTATSWLLGDIGHRVLHLQFLEKKIMIYFRTHSFKQTEQQMTEARTRCVAFVLVAERLYWAKSFSPLCCHDGDWIFHSRKIKYFIQDQLFSIECVLSFSDEHTVSYVHEYTRTHTAHGGFSTQLRNSAEQRDSRNSSRKANNVPLLLPLWINSTLTSELHNGDGITISTFSIAI